MKQSMDLVMQNFGQVLLLAFLLVLILGASAIPCGIGLLFTIPAAAFANYAAFASVVDFGDSQEKIITDHLLEDDFK